jgi:hypothetical protein
MRNFIKSIWLLPIIAFGVLFGAAVNAETVTVNEVAKLLAGDPASLDNFGYSVAVDGDTALIGAYKGYNNIGYDSGSVYVFIRDSAGNWSEQQKLSAGGVADRFGVSVALDGDTALIGAYRAYGMEWNHFAWGAAYVFTRDRDGLWTEQQKLTASDGANSQRFGWSVGLDGNTAVVGAIFDGGAGKYGAAYVFTRSDGVWVEQQKLTASVRGYRDHFGYSVAVGGDAVMIGNPGYDDNFPTIGAAYVFVRDSTGNWSEHEQQKLTASDPVGMGNFGWSVAIDGDTAVIGSPYAHSSVVSGAAYVFTPNSYGGWEEQDKLIPSDGDFNGLMFGQSVDVDGNTILIAAPHDDENGWQSGSVYLFTRSAGVWSEALKLLPSDGQWFDKLGSCALSGSTVVAGAPYHDTLGLTDAGAAYVFSFVTNTPPVADAGASQSIHVGDLVYLDGSGSYDEETASEDLLYAWQFEQVPPGSVAALVGDDTIYPSFMTDVLGDYLVSLTVTDEDGLSSAPDDVLVSTLNAPPNADAGEDQGVLIGATVDLDGSGSFDPDEDILSYAWTIQQMPIGSATFLVDAHTLSPWFQPDMAGTYGIELIVNDGYVDSDPDIVTVLVTGLDDYVCERMSESVNLTAYMPRSSFTTKGNKKALSNFLRLGCENTQLEELDEAQHKLEQTLSRTDGCILRGEPDQAGGEPGIKKDFVIDCQDQAVIYPLILEALEALTP